MVAFVMDAAELYVLSLKIKRPYMHHFLGFIPPPDPDMNVVRKLIPEIWEYTLAREDLSLDDLAMFIKMIDVCDIEICASVSRPQETFEELDTTGYSKELLATNILETLPKHRIIRSVTGRWGDTSFTVIRDGVTYFFISEATRYGDLNQIIQLLYHSISKEKPYAIDPLDVNASLIPELTHLDKISSDFGFSPKDLKWFNEILASPLTQKITLVIEAKSFTHNLSSPLGIGIADMEGKGRIISKPYESFDGSVWIKYLPGTEQELERALREGIDILGVDWFAHQK